MKKKCWIVYAWSLCCLLQRMWHSKSMETMSDFASGESSMNAAIENEDYKNEGEIAAEEWNHIRKWAGWTGGRRTEIDPHRLSVFADDRV